MNTVYAVQVVLHTELERKLPRFMLEKVDKMELIEYPNNECSRLGFIDMVIRNWFCNPFNEDGRSSQARAATVQRHYFIISFDV